MKIEQSMDQPVNVATWRRDEEFEQYPEGARDKTLFDVPVKLSSERAAFMLQLLSYRHQRLLQIIEY